MIRHPLPFTGSSRASSPASSVVWDALTPRHPSRRASFPSLGGTSFALLVRLSRWAAARAPRAWGFSPVSPTASERGSDEVSQVPGEPRCGHALFSDPGGIGYARPITARPMRPSAQMTASAPTTSNSFEALSHGLPTRCLRLAARVTPPPRKTRFRLPTSFTGRDWLPAGFQRKVSASTSHPPFPGFTWRTIRDFRDGQNGLGGPKRMAREDRKCLE